MLNSVWECIDRGEQRKHAWIPHHTYNTEAACSIMQHRSANRLTHESGQQVMSFSSYLKNTIDFRSLCDSESHCLIITIAIYGNRYKICVSTGTVVVGPYLHAAYFHDGGLSNKRFRLVSWFVFCFTNKFNKYLTI